MQKRLFIVSNRLPLSVEKQETGGYVSRQSSGGLVSAVEAYVNHGGKDAFNEKIWAGVADCSPEAWNSVQQEGGATEYKYLPVFMDEEEYAHYYQGFSNSVIWPLFHYFPTFADYSLTNYQAYMRANELFADVLEKQLRKDDVVWIHDYHLLPLAGMLRKRMPGLTIGFFLHIPFPSYELFREMPKLWQRELLSGMLGADLVGFHTMDYAQHFLKCVERILKVGHEGQCLWWENRQLKATAFPISIDYHQFNSAYDDPKVAELRQHYLELKGDKKLIFSVDRLDYTKGVPNRLRGYKMFLTEYPEYKEKVLFALNIVPSRDSISRYQERKKMIDEYIANLNSRIGSISWQPVLYQYNHLSFEELMALYTACDLALITPLRDGMNLVSKEFVASRKDKRGVLVLSEMAGAAKELQEALLINPNDRREIAEMIKTGLEMSPEEQAERLSAMQRRISRYDVNAWASDFFEELNDVKGMQLEFEIKFLDNLTKAELLDSYASADKRLLLLDYDGTLVPFSKFPHEAVPNAQLMEILGQLCDNPQNDVYIVSGRDSATLEQWMGMLPIGLIAEHGAKIRHKDAEWVTEGNKDMTNWMPKVEKIMDGYVAKCPHTFIEKKEFSLAWHYRNADLAQGAIWAKDLLSDLEDKTEQLPLNVLNGNKVIEVRPKGVNKGTAISKVLEGQQYDFILCLGDDKTDEDMFKKLARLPYAYTIKIGNEASFAKYNLHTPYVVHSLLEALEHYKQTRI
ncbi:MAG: bifunctional alpha,alpha-trehalose-phosphate synthase (UDP-forming)/trehalose-phosphatase [Flavipsychrobacter sp.]